MGEKFNWDRLLKRKPEKDADNTIQLPTEPTGAPMAPLQAANAPVAHRPTPPPPTSAAPEPPANRAPLVIEWEDFENTQSEAPATFEPIPVEAPGGTPGTNSQFWENLGLQTQNAMATPPPTEVKPAISGWTDVELTPSPEPPQPAAESDLMAGTRNAESYGPIETPYVRPSDEEIKVKTDQIANSPLWDEPGANAAEPVAQDVPPQSAPIQPSEPTTSNNSTFAKLDPIPTKDDISPDAWLSGGWNETTVNETTESPAPTGAGCEDAVAPSAEPAWRTPEAPTQNVVDPIVEAAAEVVDEPGQTTIEDSFGETSPDASADEWTNESSSTTAWPTIEDAAPEPSSEPVFDQLVESGEQWENSDTPTENDTWYAFDAEAVEETVDIQEDHEPVSETVADAPEFQSPEAWEESLPAPILPAEPDNTDPVFVAENNAPSDGEPKFSEPLAEPLTNSQASPDDFWAGIAAAQNPTPATAVDSITAPEPEPVAACPTEAIEVAAGAASDLRIGDVLLKHKLVAPAQLERALARQQQSNEKLGQVLVSMGLISERRLLQVLATQKGVSPWHLEDDAPNQAALGFVDHETCRLFQVLPVAVRGDLLLLAMRNTDDQEAISAIRNASGKRVEPVLADEARLAATIDVAYGIVRENHAQNVEDIVAIAHEHEVNLSDGAIVNPERPDHLSALFRELSADAKRKSATSITIALGEGTGEILYRIHGRLCPVQRIPTQLAQSVIENAQADLADGQVPFEIDPSFKVALTTGQHGENFVVTLPQAAKEAVGLDSMDIDVENLHLLRELTDRPYGLFLIAGSARSGIEATTHALAQELERLGRAVTRATEGESIAEQIQLAVTSESEVIIVGELIYEADVRAAVKAASSGHLIVADVTANDAPTAIQQIVSYGADPYLLATVLNGVWCQATAPKLCLQCRSGHALSDEERSVMDSYGQRQVTQVFEATGCDACNQTGVSGQIVLSEVLPVSSDVSLLINEKAPAERIANQAGFAGYLPLSYDALSRVIHGDMDFVTAKRLVSFSRRELSAISRLDAWRTQAS